MLHFTSAFWNIDINQVTLCFLPMQGCSDHRFKSSSVMFILLDMIFFWYNLRHDIYCNMETICQVIGKYLQWNNVHIAFLTI